MKWTPGGQSSNVEDRRGQSGFGGGGIGVRGLGLGGTVILLILSLVFGKNFFSLLGSSDSAGYSDGTTSAPVQSTPEEDRLVSFVSFVLDSTQSFWSSQLQANGRQYQPAKLVLFRDAVRSACGFAESATGPFYCPSDQKVYVDLAFYQELQQRFGAPGDFAQAYVIAHELGHHVQHLLGYDEQGQRGAVQGENGSSVRLELQADCLAGVWGHRAAEQGLLEPGDAEEGLNAAAAVGDDRLQKASTGYVSPESFTHGSSAQRLSWFKRGLTSGQASQCDTWG